MKNTLQTAFFRRILQKTANKIQQLISEESPMNQAIEEPNKNYFSLNDLDRKLERYLDYDNGFYVELGANDGIHQSNTFHFELARNWKGILIEPLPNNYLKCRENRSPNNFIYCNACVGFDYKQKYVDIIYANLMTISQNLNLDLKNPEQHIEKGKQFLRENETVFAFGAVAATLTKLLKEANAPALVDFLSLDVEGAEFDVLMGIDFDLYNFKYMLIEIRDFPRIERFLLEKKYRYLEAFSEHDYLFTYCGKHTKQQENPQSPNV